VGLEKTAKQIMNDTLTCFICAGTDFVSRFPKYGGEYYQCQNCKLLISSLRSEAVDRHDRDSSFSGAAERDLNINIEKEYSEKSQKKFTRELQKLELFRQTGHLLDIGCGTGGFLYAAGKAGWKCRGTEVSKQAANAAKKKNINVFLGPLEADSQKAELVDIIRMNDVIEHLQDPAKDIRLCHELLRPGGLLLLTTVNINSATFHFLQDQWRYIDPRYHIHLFTHNNLRDMLEKNGFSVISLETSGIRTAPGQRWKKYLLKPFIKISHKGHRMRIKAVRSAPHNDYKK